MHNPTPVSTTLEQKFAMSPIKIFILVVLLSYVGLVAGLRCYQCQYVVDHFGPKACADEDPGDGFLVDVPDRLTTAALSARNHSSNEHPLYSIFKITEFFRPKQSPTPEIFCSKRTFERYGKLIEIWRGYTPSGNLSWEGCRAYYDHEIEIFECYCNEDRCNSSSLMSLNAVHYFISLVLTGIFVF